MEFFGYLVLIVALILFGVLAFKQVSPLVLAPLVTIFVLVCFRLPILSSLKEQFMPAASGYVTSYFFVFFVGAVFGAIYQTTGAAEAIARGIASVSHGKFVAPIIMIITGILTYGGISGFVVFFVVYPIALNLFKEANLTRRLIPAAISAGTWTWSMTGPGSPSIQNIIAAENLGTPATAALVPSIITTVATFVMIFVWLEYRARSFTGKGILFDDKTLKYQLTAEELSSDDDGKDLPNVILAWIPIIVILVLYNLPESTGFKQPVETAVMVGIILSVIFFFKKIPSVGEWLNIFNQGAANSGVSILNTAIVVGFGGVVQNTEAFANLVEMLKGLRMNPLVFVMITVAVCAGACGSASGGMTVAFNALKETFIELGANFEYVHRISAIAAGTLDTLPHQGAQITLLGICKLTHKEAYFDIAITQILIPFIACGLFIVLANFGM